MNKKLFTLAAALMMGSAFTVNAQTKQVSDNPKVTDLGSWYYIGNSAEADVADRVYLSGKIVNPGAKEVTILENATTVGGTKGANVKNKDKFLWKITVVTKNGVIDGYQLTNKLTGGKITFKATTTAEEGGQPTTTYTVASSSDDKINIFNWAIADGNGKYKNDGGVIEIGGNHQVSTGQTLLTNNGESWAIYTQDATELDAKNLNSLMGGKTFSLGFPKADPQPAENVLAQKLTAVTVDVHDWAGIDDNDHSYDYLNGTYFVVSTPKDALDEDGEFQSMALFKASTFVAVEPEANYGLSGNSRANGHGFGLKVVNGRDLVSAADAKAKGQIAAANAQFTVTEKDAANNPGEYTVKATPVVMTNAEAGKEKWEAKEVTITAVTSAGTTYVMTAAGNNTVCKAGASSTVKASEILSADGASIYTVQFLSGAKDKGASEYGKYLGVYDNAGIQLLAQGPAYLNLDAPQNQWVVTAYDATNGVTFTNRELPGTTFKAVLVKTDVEGVYEVSGGDSKTINWCVTEDDEYQVSDDTKQIDGTDELLISLKPVTVDPAAGYADYTEAQLRDIATLKFSASDLLAKTIYVGWDLTTTQNDFEAAQWDLIKNAAVKDSIYGSTTYAYIKKGEETASKSIEDKAITTYALKLRGVDLYLGYDDQENEYTLNQEPQNFVIKENPDGTASLILAESSVYSVVVNKTTKAMALDTDGTLTLTNIYSFFNPDLQIEMGQVAPSLESVARHASFQSVNGGFLAVGADRQAMIAATSEEATNLTFWLDTVDVDAVTPAFYISQSPSVLKADAEVRNYLWNPTDSAIYYDEGKASYVTDRKYYLNNDINSYMKAMFKSATADELVDANKFQIVLATEDSEDQYVIRSVKNGAYLSNRNGKVILTKDSSDALIVKLGAGDATANEAIAAESGVQVIGGEGVVTVQGAAGKVITVANILGQTIANQVAASDNVTIAAPAGVVVVAVDGEATKVVVK